MPTGGDCRRTRQCQLEDLDYSRVDDGRIACRHCGWGWVLVADDLGSEDDDLRRKPPRWKRVQLETSS
jgi:hypothetical protein